MGVSSSARKWFQTHNIRFEFTVMLIYEECAAPYDSCDELLVDEISRVSPDIGSGYARSYTYSLVQHSIPRTYIGR